jgi:hypothetical protein
MRPTSNSIIFLPYVTRSESSKRPMASQHNQVISERRVLYRKSAL